MDPESITLIMEALKFGSAEIAAGRLNQKGIEQWNRLNTAIKGIFVGQANAQIAFAEYENDPDVWIEPLKKMLIAVKAHQNKEIMALARKLKALEDAQQERSSQKNVINANGGTVQGVVQENNGYVTIIYQNGERHTVPFLAPPKPPYELVGRDELLSQLKEWLFAGDYVALNGLPGVGKTALVVALAHDPEVLAHFKDGVLWAGLGREPDVGTLLDKWGMALGIPSDEMAKLTDMDDKGDKIKTRISEESIRILLVIDDAWDIEDAEAFRLDVPNCAHIVTTRFPEIALDFADDNTQQVPELSPVDGLRLLKRLAAKVIEDEPEEANELVKLVGGLPLGLILMGRLLKKEGRNKRPRRIRKALDKLKQVEERLALAEKPLRKHHPNLPKRAKVSLDAIITVSYEALDKESRRTLRAISVFLPKPNTFSEEAAKVVANDLLETLDTLEDYGLLEGSGERYELHQTIADYASLKCGGDERVLFEQRAATFFANFAQQHSNSKDYPLLDLDWRNISHSMEWAYKHKQWEALLDGVQGLTHHNLGVVGFMDARGHWSNARELLPKALKGAKELGDQQVKASILTKMGAFAFRQSEIDKAEEYLQQSLGILKQLPSSEKVLLQRSYLYEFKSRLELRHDPKVALESIERGIKELNALPLKTKTVSHQKGHLYILFSSILGQIGQLDKAIQEANKGLKLLPKSPTSSKCLGLMVLGNAYSYQGKIEESLKYQKEGIEVAQKLGDLRREAHFWNNIGLDEGDRGNCTVAIDHFERALTLYQKIGSVDEQVDLYNNLGMYYIVLGEDEPSNKNLTTAIALAKRYNLNEEEALSQAHLANLLICQYQEQEQEQNKLDQAESALTKAEEIAIMINDPYILSVVLHRQAETSRLKGQYDQALQLVEKLITTEKESYLLEKGMGWSIKGKVLDAMQRFDEAFVAHQKSLEILEKDYPYERAQSQQALAEHFIMCDEMLSDRAESLLTKALATFEWLGAKRDIRQTKALLKNGN